MTDTSVPALQILLAEDNAADVLLVQEVLKEEGIACTLHVMKDGEQAIKFIDGLDGDPAALPLDLVLLDMHLPKRDGGEILDGLWSTQCCAQTPVIVMTASDAPPDDARARKHALQYFRKPSSLSEYMRLGAMIREATNKEATPHSNARPKRTSDS